MIIKVLPGFGPGLLLLINASYNIQSNQGLTRKFLDIKIRCDHRYTTRPDIINCLIKIYILLNLNKALPGYCWLGFVNSIT